MAGARQLKVVICMFCGEAPCVCGKANKPAAKPARVKKAPSNVSPKSPEAPPTISEVGRAAPIVRPAIPTGQGFTPRPIKDSLQTPPRAADRDQTHDSPTGSPTRTSETIWAGSVYGESQSGSTFSELQGMEDARLVTAAIRNLIAGGLIDEENCADHWRTSLRGRSSAR